MVMRKFIVEIESGNLEKINKFVDYMRDFFEKNVDGVFKEEVKE